MSKERHPDVNLSDLREIWQIGLGSATKTLKVTTQRMLRSAIMPISRQYRADHMFEWPYIQGAIFKDKMVGRYKFLDGNHYAQVFTNDSLFAAEYPMDKKILSGQGLREFIAYFGVLDRLVCDRYKDQTSKWTDFTKEVRKHGMDLHVTNPDYHNQLLVESVIREI